ncbi:MAG TPA: Xaa-Pro peptidase family protein [Acidimicrobiia bacterium]|nr:Xaa-Pro peptidase family protein [Acidimicrobiia bacterium]
MTSFDYGARIERARQALSQSGIDGLLLSVGPDLPYLTGYEAMPLERLTMFVLTGPRAVLIVPELEAPRVAAGPFEVRPWSETEDPVAIVAELVAATERLALGDHTWAVFLLGLQDRLPDVAFEACSELMAELRMRKEEGEIDLLRLAAHATDRVAARLAETRMSGMTERQLSLQVGRWTVEEGHDLDTFRIVASGPNGASPHHEPTDRVIEEGDMVVIDFGGRLGGYCSDMTRTFVVGDPTPEQEEVHDLVQVAQRAAVDAVRPGVTAAHVDAAARSVIEAAGYGEHFIHRTGHGIGLEGHEHPYIIETNSLPLEEGMAFSVEPGIYLPGRFGVRIEDIVVVTSSGVEPLNRANHDLVVVD